MISQSLLQDTPVHAAVVGAVVIAVQWKPPSMERYMALGMLLVATQVDPSEEEEMPFQRKVGEVLITPHDAPKLLLMYSRPL